MAVTAIPSLVVVLLAVAAAVVGMVQTLFVLMAVDKEERSDWVKQADNSVPMRRHVDIGEVHERLLAAHDCMGEKSRQEAGRKALATSTNTLFLMQNCRSSTALARCDHWSENRLR